MDSLKICYVQCELLWEDPKGNREQIEKWLLQEKESCDLIVLPEMFTTGFTMKPQQIAEEFSLKMETIAWMKTIAKIKSSVLMGTVAVRVENKFYNRMLIVFPNGKVEFYDKIHLFSLTNEHRDYTAGEQTIVIEIKGWKILPQICYDLRFPESARNKIIEGNPLYDLLVYAANWPKSRIQQWKTLIAARAIENQCYAIGVNRIGSDENGLEYDGNSIAFDFLGERLDTRPGLAQEINYVEIHKKELSIYRSGLPFLWDQ